ncbi:MAG TPA: BglII/BstYI family type II restriction endonuclease, partial [Tepidisphaeraceae bacterium]|nr:BglII/BstYI family type II restriction endonuclease [Tepidisphaeraceae bacterium]
MTEINPQPNPQVGPLANLRTRGFDVLCTSHSQAILGNDFADALRDIEEVLSGFTINIEEIVRGGGGEAPFTQRLRRALNLKNWTKREFKVRKFIDDVETQATSHEVDHVKAFERGTVALEIEWNNKDPFYDRDLDNFKRLHADGGISVGVIITRGMSLQNSIPDFLRRFASEKNVA